jgi:hypothetical protein
LQAIEAIVEAPALSQFAMRATFDNLAVMEHEDLVRP